MPELVTLPGALLERAARPLPAPPRKRRGRDHADVMATHAAEEIRVRRTATLRGRPHMCYDPDTPSREEVARHLNFRARTIIGVDEYRAI